MKKYWLFFLLTYTGVLNLKAQVVINEVYGGGGNSGAMYKNDFIELYNKGNSDVNLSGWSVQYASAAGSTWAVTPLTGLIKAGGFYLIQQAAGAGGSANLPNPDATGNIAISGTAGKVILTNSITALTGSCPPALTDLVGFGTAANCFEGSGAAPAPSNSNSIERTPVGQDTQNNAADFAAGLPSPTNSIGADIVAPAFTNLAPANATRNTATSFTASIGFTESIVKGDTGKITIKRFLDDSVVTIISVGNEAVTVSGNTAYFTVAGLALSSRYFIEVSTGAFKDLSGNSFVGISGSANWSFTTSATVAFGNTDSTYDFTDCTTSLPGGFTSFSAAGAATWACTSFGRDPANPASATAYGNAVQINGFTNGTNVLNKDWLISPAFNLSATSFPLLSFWSRNAFNGAALQLKVSTDYPGTGDPGNYNWIDINGKFPAQASNIWTLSENINLAQFKSPQTYIAFLYQSTPEDGARWTLDDIRIGNSSTAPPASLTINTTDIQFGYVPVSTAGVKSFMVTGNDLTGPLTLTASADYLLSKTNDNFTSSISYTAAEANNIAQTVYIQLLPTQASKNYAGMLTINTPGVEEVNINLTGNSIDAALTLEVVNWNLEWFGSADPALGPTNKSQQLENVKIITKNIAADIFGFVEVVNEACLQNVVANLNKVFGAGTYSYVLSNYGSYTNPFVAGAGPLGLAQKAAFVYKNSVICPIGMAGALLSNGVNLAADTTNPAYNYFSSGRYPFMMNANVTLGGITKPIRFVLLHAKANTSPTATSYNRRKAGADTLNYTLNKLYPADNILLMGDFNDDLDKSITAGFTVSSYNSFNQDSTNFYSPSLPLSLAGKKSTVSYNDMIDHVTISTEFKPFYMPNSASVLSDVSSLVKNYGTTTSDHYPIFTRYAFDATILPVQLMGFTVTNQHDKAIIQWTTAQEYNSQYFYVLRSTDSSNWVIIGVVAAAGNSNTLTSYLFTDLSPAQGVNFYRLKQVDADEKITFSLIKNIRVEKESGFAIAPNPARDLIKIDLYNYAAARILVELIDLNGKTLYQKVTVANFITINAQQFAKGNYIIKITNGNKVVTKKLLLQ